MSKLSNEAYELIMRLLEEELSVQDGHEDRKEEVGTVIEEIQGISTF